MANGAIPHYSLLIGDKETKGNGSIIEIENPATGEIKATCDTASTEDVKTAIDLGESTFKSGIWSRMDPPDRAAILSSIAHLLSSRISSLALLESSQTGRPLREMSIQLTRLSEWFEYFAALVRTEEGGIMPTRGKLLNYVKRSGLGVVGLLTSFNHPMLISVKKLAPALAAGNSVVLKPSELAPLAVLELGKICYEAGLPPGVLSILPGYGPITGKALVDDPRIKKIDLTGGTANGKLVASISGGNLANVTLELGGKAPILVFENVDLDLAINGVAFASYIASGQTCVAGTRILVQKSIYPSFVKALLAKSASITSRIGNPLNPASMMGPIISAKQLKNIETLVDSARLGGGIILCGGERMKGNSELDGFNLDKGYFYPPTIITADDSSSSSLRKMKVWEEEIFGPVITICSFATEEEGIELANDSKYGLGAAVWTRDGGQAIRVADKLECGIVWVNTHHRNDPSSPWGGTKDSGIGRENGREAYYSYTKSKSTVINYAPEDESRVTDDWFREGDAAVRYG